MVLNTAPLPFFRFLAACIVVMFHFGQKMEQYPRIPEVFKAGSLMVTFFFVLSGFVLFLGYSRKTFDWRQYLVKRAVKILPMYYLAFLVSAGLLFFLGRLPLSDFFLNLFCLQSWFPYPLTVNFTSWFVSALMFCYCLFPLVLFFLRKVRPDGRLVLFAGLLFWTLTQWVVIRIVNSETYPGNPYWSYNLIYYFPPFHCCSFVLGICGAYYLMTKEAQVRKGGIHSSLITLFLLGAVAMIVQCQPVLEKLAGYRLPFGVSLYAPVMLLLLMQLTLSRNRLLEILSWPKFILWGEMSYAIFILQAPLDKLDNYFLSSYYDMGPGMHFIFFFMLLLCISLPAAMVEKTVGKRIGRRLMVTD